MINDIKAKLPLKKKAADEEDELDENEGKVGGQDVTDPSMVLTDKTSSTDIRDLSEEEDEEVEEPKSLVDKLKAKFAPKKKAAAAADDDEDGDTKKKPEKKKINPVVLVVVLGGLGFFLFYENEETAVETVPEVKPISKIKKVPVEDRPKTEAAPADAAPADAATDTAVAETPTDATAPVDAAAPTDTVATAPVDESVPAEPIINEPTPTEPIATGPVIDEPVEPEPTSPIEEPVVTDTPDVPDTSTIAPESVDSVDGQVATDESSMTDKILEDLEKQVKKDQPKELKKEYVAPPDYEYKGRGLVYNCTGKHWACVDAPSYKTCEDNHSSVTFKKKTVECYPFNVYESTKGCEAMQNRVVSSNAKTDFCKGN